ncbi:MAG: S-methyl-5'-thioadenosine phosphorylase [Chloroflexi bacterium]|nr:S-methyl-5'-thioadenosine phosphorylase [Chloroflexota bacterium]
MSTVRAKVGVIGGSGLYRMEGLENVSEVRVGTPFGDPSDSITVGTLQGTPIAFLPRHGVGHRLLPSELPARANIWALKSIGVERVVSVSAVGSLQEEYRPLELVVPDQLVDRTKGRPSTFFGDGVVAHVSFAEPFCGDLSERLAAAARQTPATIHKGGTYVVMEGPAFSTRAESFSYRVIGAHIIGMTALPEAKLAREAEMCYATLACVTDYDCWREETEHVTIELVIRNLNRNVANAQLAVRQLLPLLAGEPKCACRSSLKDAIITDRARIPSDTRKRLELIAGKYLK